MVSQATGLPASFVPGEKRNRDRSIDLTTAKNVEWGVKLCDALYSTPSIAGGRIFIGGVEADNGVFACLDQATGRLLWQWKRPAKEFPRWINGFLIGISEIPQKMGVCSSAAVDGDRSVFRVQPLRGRMPGCPWANPGIPGRRRPRRLESRL